jgi:hypothetical protein
MSDENRDPASKPTKIRPKPLDTRSAAASSFDKVQNQSSLDSPKSATITNVSQRLPSTSAEVSVGEILSTDEKRASVSIREEQQRRHSASSYSSSETGDIAENTGINNKEQSKMDLGEASRELTRLLHIGNENTTTAATINLNPDAPDFTPVDLTPTYHSELAPAHLQRRATQVEFYNDRHSRTRYYSDTQHNPIPLTSTNTSGIRPLLSLVPQYVPSHRRSWNSITPLSSSSTSNSWWPQEYSNTSSAASSYHSRPAYALYSVVKQQPLTDENNYSYNQQQNRNSSKRQRTFSGRSFVHPSQTLANRKRSHSGPQPPLQPPSAHLTGIHSLTRIMVDILRIINPIPTEDKKQKSDSISSVNLTSYSPIQHKYQRPSYHYTQERLEEQEQQQRTQSIEGEDVFVDDNTSTIAPLPILDNKTAGNFILIRLNSLHIP